MEWSKLGSIPVRPPIFFRTDYKEFTCRGCGKIGLTMTRTQVWCLEKDCQEKRRRGEQEKYEKRRARGVKPRVKW